MIRRLLRRASARVAGNQQSLPFDMFDTPETKIDRKLEGLYHRGQAKAWDGKEVLSMLLERHGGIQLPQDQRDALNKVFAVILWGELAAWKISADLANRLDPLEAKLAATSQVHDEARHFYVMKDYLAELSVVPREVGPKTARVLNGTLRADTLVKKLMGMQLMIEPMALALFQTMRKSRLEPVLADLLAYFERDEARHVALGVLYLPQMIKNLSRREAFDLWSWEFREFWCQIEMIKELEPHFRTLGIDPRFIAETGRTKQVKANVQLMEELGYEPKVLHAFVRFFDAKIAFAFPQTRADRMSEALAALGRGIGIDDASLTDLKPI